MAMSRTSKDLSSLLGGAPVLCNRDSSLPVSPHWLDVRDLSAAEKVLLGYRGAKAFSASQIHWMNQRFGPAGLFSVDAGLFPVCSSQ